MTRRPSSAPLNHSGDKSPHSIGPAHFRFSVSRIVAFSPPVKTPELPNPKPSTRSYVPRIVDPAAPGDEREEKFLPRYVEVPALREHGFGRRNLVWGVVTLALALALLVAAVVLTGQKAVLSLAACLVTCAALFVLARMHVFRQRNGGFLAIALVVLLGAVVALVDRGYEVLAGIAAPQTAVAAHPVETEPPLLMQAFALAKPDGTQPQVKVLKDSRVVIAEKPYIIKAGDVFPLLEAKAGEATFAVRDLHVSLPVEVVEILGGKPAKEVVAGKEVKETKESAMAAALAAVNAAAANAAEPQKTEPASNAARPAADGSKPETAGVDLAAVTRSAQLEAMRRYPALAIKDSVENEVFVTTYRQLKERGNAEFFSNPEWPLELAEKLATENGWARGDHPAPAAAEPAEAPGIEPPGMEPNAPAGSATGRTPQLPPADLEPPQIPRAKRR